MSIKIQICVLISFSISARINGYRHWFMLFAWYVLTLHVIWNFFIPFVQPVFQPLVCCFALQVIELPTRVGLSHFAAGFGYSWTRCYQTPNTNLAQDQTIQDNNIVFTWKQHDDIMNLSLLITWSNNSVKCVSKMRFILTRMFYAIYRAVYYQPHHYCSDDCENICTLSYHNHQIGNIIYNHCLGCVMKHWCMLYVLWCSHNDILSNTATMNQT